MAYTTINKSGDYFNTKLYTGNSTDNHTISGVGFQPDFLWIKDRDRSGYNHRLQDSVRGSTKSLISNLTNTEQTNADAVKSFNSDGFVLGDDTGNGSFNGNSNFVSWNWKAGGTVSNNNNNSGQGYSTVSANTTAGFSIVKYTGTGSNTNFGHGLGVAPSMILFKNLISSGGSAEHWVVYHKDVGATKGLYLNLTNAQDTSNAFFNDTAPTSSVFYVGNADKTNKSGEAQIAYCFAEKTGYSKFGSYVGNGSNDGTFVYTGFKPAFLMIKNTGTTENWNIWDNKRDTYNAVESRLYPNTNDAESTSDSNDFDFLSNGFKIRNNGGNQGASGNTYIYMAFAEAPLVGSNNVPCTAR